MVDANTAALYLHFNAQEAAELRYEQAAAQFPLDDFKVEAEVYVDGEGSPEFINDVFFATGPNKDGGSDVLHRLALWAIGKYDFPEFSFAQWQRDRDWLKAMRQEAITECAKVLREKRIQEALHP